MNYNTTTTASASAAAAALKEESWPSAVPLASPASSPAAVQSPCAACKTLRRRCAEKCMLAPYFPPHEPLKFAIAHRIFGASNIIKMLQELPEGERVDAVNSMVYEANARLRDPIYGCAGAICSLQTRINELQVELAKAKAEILNMQCQNANLVHLICSKNQEILSLGDEHQNNENPTLFFDEGIINGDPLFRRDEGEAFNFEKELLIQ